MHLDPPTGSDPDPTRPGPNPTPKPQATPAPTPDRSGTWAVTRRALLGGSLGAGLAGLAATAGLRPLWFDLAGAQTDAGVTGGGEVPSTPAFPDGVASGDPLPDGSVVWTRVAEPVDGADVALVWRVFDEDGNQVATGTTVAAAADFFSTRVRVAGLDPDRWYRYEFEQAGSGELSPRGRLRTAPPLGSSPSRLRFAFSSCQQRSSPYTAHRAILAEDVDFFVHLGDYIYVSDGGTITLDDYRGVWRTFHTDPALQELRRQVPLVAMWDDGEFYNGVDATGPAERLAAAKRAFFEFQPVIPPADDPQRCYRWFEWGDLATLPVVDVRSYRDPEVPATDTETPEGAVALDPERTTLGAEQREWLLSGLAQRDVTWRLVSLGYNVLPLRLEDRDTPERRASGEVFPPNAGNYFPNEAFDDFQVERREMLQRIVDECIENVVFLAAHTHVFLAGRLYPDYDDVASPLAAHEFVSGSLTADPPPEGTAKQLTGQELPRDEAITLLRQVEQIGLSINAHLDHINMVDQGYVIVDVTPDEVHVQFRVLDTFDTEAVATTSWEARLTPGMTPSGCGATTTTTTTTAPGTSTSAPEVTTPRPEGPAEPKPLVPRYTG